MVGGSSPSTPATFFVKASQGLSLMVTNSQYKAQLQQLGIDVYDSIEQLDVAELPWLKDVCKLLNTELADCQFDTQTPHYDASLNILHLPSSSYSSELAFKKALWQHLRPFVSRP